MRIKEGVRIRGIGPEAVVALMVADAVYAVRGFDMVVTSATDGKHSAGSLHYAGEAVDIRTRDVPEDQRGAIRDEIAARLGANYDVLLEADHIHIEHDPG